MYPLSNHMRNKVWHEITYLFPNCTVEIWEWINNFITSTHTHRFTTKKTSLLCIIDEADSRGTDGFPPTFSRASNAEIALLCCHVWPLLRHFIITNEIHVPRMQCILLTYHHRRVIPFEDGDLYVNGESAVWAKTIFRSRDIPGNAILYARKYKQPYQIIIVPKQIAPGSIVTSLLLTMNVLRWCGVTFWSVWHYNSHFNPQWIYSHIVEPVFLGDIHPGGTGCLTVQVFHIVVSGFQTSCSIQFNFE